MGAWGSSESRGAQCLNGLGVWGLQHQQMHDLWLLEQQGSMEVVSNIVVLSGASGSSSKGLRQAAVVARTCGVHMLSSVPAAGVCVCVCGNRGQLQVHVWWQGPGPAAAAGVRADGVLVHGCRGQLQVYMW